MRIITKRHWRGWNSEDAKESEWARKSAHENWEIYRQQLETLRPRLSKKNFEFFKKGLHDGRLISFSIGDGLHLDLSTKEQMVTISDFLRTSVEIKVLNAEFNAIYDLKYGKVTKSVFDFPSDDPLWGKNIDDWGYDELSEVNEKVLRHEVLFSSGASILIEFEKFSFQKTKYDGSRY
ncbi:MAG TPA: hypothetical protein PKA82_02340 [Pyrinomonadaceae bacterium]|nr:hypothetical protein [Pyrinomonadaceae bacterium]